MNTIIGLKEPPGIIYSRFAKEYGVDANPKALQSRFRPAFKEMEINYPCYGFDSFGPTAWWIKLVKKCFGEDSKFGDDGAFDDMALRIYEYYSTKEPWKLLEHDVLQQLDRLRSHGLAVSITSNFDSRLRSILLDFGILNHIDYIALSGELGVAKPDPQVFNGLMDFFNLSSPKEILHIGDSIEKDVQGAADFGAHYCLYGSEQTEEIQGIPFCMYWRISVFTPKTYLLWFPSLYLNVFFRVMSEPQLTPRAQAYKKKLKGPLKLHLEPLVENPVIEYQYDGTEKHAPPFNIDDVTADLACKIDWRSILGPDDTLEPLYNAKSKEVEEEEKQKEVEKTEEEQDQEHMEKLTDTMVPEAGPWAAVAKALNDSLAEVDNLLDIIRIVKDGNGLIVGTVAAEVEKQDVLSAQANSSKAFMWQAHRKILAEAAKVFEPFISTRKQKKDVELFFKELREMRKMFIVRKVGENLIGDLGYRIYGPRWNPSETFDIYRVEENKRSAGLKKNGKTVSTMIEVDVPRHSAVRTSVFVSLAFDGEGENLFKKRVINVIQRADGGNIESSKTNGTLDEDVLEKMESRGENQNLSRMAYWPNALKWARDTLFYRDMFTQLTRECANLVGRSCSIRDDIIVVSLFENVMLKIEKCESPFVDGDLTDLGDSYLKSMLKSFFYDEVTKPKYRGSFFVPIPNTTAPLHSELDGPFAAPEDDVIARNPTPQLLIEKLISVTSHYYLIKSAIEVITEHQSKFTDPVLTWKWQRNNPTNSVIFVTLSSPRFEYVPKNTFHIRVTANNIEIISKDENILDCRRDRSLLIENLHYQAALFWFTAISCIAIRTGYQCLQCHSNQFDDKFKISPTLLFLNPNGTRQMFIQLFCTGQKPRIMTRMVLDSNPNDLAPGTVDEREFTILKNSKIPGITFLKQIDTIFAFLRS